MRKICLILLVILLISCSYRNEDVLQEEKNRSEIYESIDKDVLDLKIEKSYNEEPIQKESKEYHIIIKDIKSSNTNKTNTKKDIENNEKVVKNNKPDHNSNIKEKPKNSSETKETTPTPPTTLDPPREPEPPLCPEARYDENKACDYIHPNMLPKDELNRDMPIFNDKHKAWEWAENEIYNEASTWYMCGFTLMEGYYNDETIFYFAYMKACPN